MRLSTFVFGAALGLSSATVATGAPEPTPDSTAPETSPPDSTAPETPPPEPPRIEPLALDALDRMGEHLRSLRAFSVHAQTRTDETLATGDTKGQKIQLSSASDIHVRRPNGLRADVISDRKARQFFYDGKTFTINAPRFGYYATVAAPPTLGALVDEAAQRYGIELPLVDLFLWGTDKIRTDDITSAIDVGPSLIDGIETEQYAFRQPGLDWQIWIDKGPEPLPRRLVLTTTDDPSKPQHAVDLTWDVAPVLDDQTFMFTPTKNSRRITLAQASQAGLDRVETR